MKSVYLCLVFYEYAGCELQGVYSSLVKARKHHFRGGDSCEIRRYTLDKDDAEGGKSISLRIARKPSRKK